MLRIRIRVFKKVVVEITAPVEASHDGRQLLPFVSVVTERKSRSTFEACDQRFLRVPKGVGKQPCRVSEDTEKSKKYVSKEPPRPPSSCGDTNQIPPTSKNSSGHHCIYNCPSECSTCWKLTRAGGQYGPRCVCKIPQPKFSTEPGKKTCYDTYIIASIFLLLLCAAGIIVWKGREPL